MCHRFFESDYMNHTALYMSLSGLLSLISKIVLTLLYKDNLLATMYLSNDMSFFYQNFGGDIII